jgi:glyoxylase-like metal-dependent hydrolase (beta-lactamase superfamily II)
VVRRPNGEVICGVFNVDRAQAADSLRKLAGLDVSVACFGHGEPLTRDAAAGLQAAARHAPSGTARNSRGTPAGPG